MNQTANQILSDFHKLEVNEADAYTHDPEERAHLFHTYGFDVATTEKEYLSFLFSLLLVEKPRKVLESGTGCGLGTLILLASIEQCVKDYERVRDEQMSSTSFAVPYAPKVHTVDTRYVPGVRLLAQKYNLSKYLRSEGGTTTLEFLAEQVETRNKAEKEMMTHYPYGFCIFDSDQKTKAQEAEFMLKNGLIAQNGVLVFHDTALSHPLNKDREYLRHIWRLESAYALQSFNFPWSRGLTIMRYPGVPRSLTP